MNCLNILLPYIHLIFTEIRSKIYFNSNSGISLYFPFTLSVSYVDEIGVAKNRGWLNVLKEDELLCKAYVREAIFF